MARKIDFWLDEHSYLGATALQIVHRAYRMSVTRLRSGPAQSLATRRSERMASNRSGVAVRVARMLVSLKERLRADNVRLAVLLMETQDRGGGFPEDQRAVVLGLGQDLGSAGIATFDGLAALERHSQQATSRGFRFEQDAHWNTSAHGIVATGLASFLAREGLLEPQQGRGPSGHTGQSP